MEIRGAHKNILFFHSFWGDLEGAGTFCHHTQAIFKSPALLGLIYIHIYLEIIRKQFGIRFNRC